MIGKELSVLANVLRQGISTVATTVQAQGVALDGRVAMAANGYVIVKIPFEISNFTGYLKGQIFTDVISMLPEETEYDITGKGNVLHVKSNTQDLTFNKMEDIEPIPQYQIQEQPIAAARELFTALQKVVPFVGIKEVMPALRGVRVKHKEVIASDNMRIAYLKLVKDTGLDIVMSFETVQRIIAVSVGRELETVGLVDNRNLILFKFTDGVEVYGTLSEVDFPELGKHFKDVQGESIPITPALIAGVKRIALCQEGVERVFDFDIQGKRIIIKGGGQYGLYKETLKLKEEVQSEFVMTLAAQEFGEVIENCTELILVSPEIVYGKGKDSRLMFAMMTIEKM